jgi:alpha-ketoglutarate-dependent taurine dioxygenase
MQFTPISDHIGVRVDGLDLGQPISEQDQSALKAALADYKLLLFRQGPISDDEHVNLLGSLGRIMHEEDDSSLFTFVGNTKDAYVRGTARLRFHSDWQCAASGPIHVISLYAVEMEHDDPTIYADMTYAVRTLPAELRARIQDYKLVQCTDFSGATPIDGQFRLSAQGPGVPDNLFPRSIHPMIAKHRITGEELLNLSEQQTSHIDGMSEPESDAVFAEIAPFQYGEANRYTHHWQVHDLIIWDDIALQHARNASTRASGRRLRRVTLNERDFVDMFPEVPDAVTMA